MFPKSLTGDFIKRFIVSVIVKPYSSAPLSLISRHKKDLKVRSITPPTNRLHNKLTTIIVKDKNNTLNENKTNNTLYTVPLCCTILYCK